MSFRDRCKSCGSTDCGRSGTGVICCKSGCGCFVSESHTRQLSQMHLKHSSAVTLPSNIWEDDAGTTRRLCIVCAFRLGVSLSRAGYKTRHEDSQRSQIRAYVERAKAWQPGYERYCAEGKHVYQTQEVNGICDEHKKGQQLARTHKAGGPRPSHSVGNTLHPAWKPMIPSQRGDYTTFDAFLLRYEQP